MEPQEAYAILGLDQGASGADIRRAYLRLAKKHHPDKNPGDKTAEWIFKQIQEAYTSLPGVHAPRSARSEPNPGERAERDRRERAERVERERVERERRDRVERERAERDRRGRVERERAERDRRTQTKRRTDERIDRFVLLQMVFYGSLYLVSDLMLDQLGLPMAGWLFAGLVCGWVIISIWYFRERDS